MKTKEANTVSNYNYQHFKPTDYNFNVFKGPKPGEEYLNFTATTLEGEEVKLSDYLDKPIVLDTGSITCPMYANTKDPMIALQEEYPEVHFLLLYVREAHPGAKVKAIQSVEDKMTNAKATLSLYNEKRTVLVDSLEGYAHNLYGAMPNMTYVIGTDGIVRFRANWTNIDALNKVLQNLDAVEEQDFYPVVKPPLSTALRTLLIGGVSALLEFLSGLPQLMRQHKEVSER